MSNFKKLLLKSSALSVAGVLLGAVVNDIRKKEKEEPVCSSIRECMKRGYVVYLNNVHFPNFDPKVLEGVLYNVSIDNFAEVVHISLLESGCDWDFFNGPTGDIDEDGWGDDTDCVYEDETDEIEDEYADSDSDECDDELIFGVKDEDLFDHLEDEKDVFDEPVDLEKELSSEESKAEEDTESSSADGDFWDGVLDSSEESEEVPYLPECAEEGDVDQEDFEFIGDIDPDFSNLEIPFDSDEETTGDLE